MEWVSNPRKHSVKSWDMRRGRGKKTSAVVDDGLEVLHELQKKLELPI